MASADTNTPLGSTASVGVPFGRYLIRRRLGRGGMGEVFLADQLGPLGPVRPVALKRMLPQLASDAAALRMFLEEMGTAAQLNHPNIATIYDFGEVDGVYFLAMEYIEGLPLNELIRFHGPLPIPEALAIIRSVAEALAHAHAIVRLGKELPAVVHRDVSPHNVMLSCQGAVKLLDFGIARAEAAVLRGGVRGKLGYAAPEQIRGAPPDRRFDIWALGILLYEMLTGARPFPDDDPKRVVEAAEEKRYAPLTVTRPEAAPLAALLERALEPDPEARWADAGRFRDASAEAAAAFPRSSQGKLALLVEQAGGAPRAEYLLETTATGVGAIDISALRGPAPWREDDPTLIRHPPSLPKPSWPGPHEEEARREESVATQEKTALVRHRGKRPLVLAALVALIAPLGFYLGSGTRGEIENPPFAEEKTEETTNVSPRPIFREEVSRESPISPSAETQRAAILGRDPGDLGRAERPGETSGRLSVRSLKAPAASDDRDRSLLERRAHASGRRSERAKAEDVRPDIASPRTRKDAPVEVRASPRTGKDAPRDARSSPRVEAGVDSAGTPPALGMLSLRSTPWARVALDGRSFGEGTLALKPIPAGKHTLTLTPGSDEYAPKTLEIEIKAGVVTKVFVDFRTGAVRIDPS